MYPGEELINLDRFPIHEPESAAYSALVDQVQSALEQDG